MSAPDISTPELKRLLSEATQGEWHADNENHGISHPVGHVAFTLPPRTVDRAQFNGLGPIEEYTKALPLYVTIANEQVANRLLLARSKVLAEEVVKLRRLLEPLAKVAELSTTSRQIRDESAIWHHSSNSPDESFSLTVGDCRAAQHALALHQPSGPAQKPANT